MELFTLATILALAHFTLPLLYYRHMGGYLRRPWGLRTNPGHVPRVSVVVPIHNEADVVWEKLDDIYRQDYPKGMLEVVIVDSGSTDGSPQRVLEYASRRPDLRVVLVHEPVRRGKALALNAALSRASGDLVVVTDADSLWAGSDTLRRLASIFSDPSVGSVSCVKIPQGGGPGGVEEAYRRYYNVLRVGESRAYSTPVFHGELAAFRRSLLEELGGFPTYTGSDDSHTATLIALRGYRSVVVEDLVCAESLPRRGYALWRARRAQHLVQHFAHVLRHVPRAKGVFRLILLAEAYLHLLNPWLLVAALALLLIAAARDPLPPAAALAAGLALLAYRPYRTWIASQLFLILGALMNLGGKGDVWKKVPKARP